MAVVLRDVSWESVIDRKNKPVEDSFGPGVQFLESILWAGRCEHVNDGPHAIHGSDDINPDKLSLWSSVT